MEMESHRPIKRSASTNEVLVLTRQASQRKREKAEQARQERQKRAQEQHTRDQSFKDISLQLQDLEQVNRNAEQTVRSTTRRILETAGPRLMRKVSKMASMFRTPRSTRRQQQHRSLTVSDVDQKLLVVGSLLPVLIKVDLGLTAFRAFLAEIHHEHELNFLLLADRFVQCLELEMLQDIHTQFIQYKAKHAVDIKPELKRAIAQEAGHAMRTQVVQPSVITPITQARAEVANKLSEFAVDFVSSQHAVGWRTFCSDAIATDNTEEWRDPVLAPLWAQETLLAFAVAMHNAEIPTTQNLREMFDLADVLDERGKHSQALPLHRDLVRLCRLRLGENDVSTMAARHNLSNCLYLMDEMEEFMAVTEELILQKMRVLGPAHPSTLLAKNNYALALKDVGKHSQATDLLVDVVLGFEQMFGENDPRTLNASGNLWVAKGFLGEPDATQQVESIACKLEMMEQSKQLELWVAKFRCDLDLLHHDDPVSGLPHNRTNSTTTQEDAAEDETRFLQAHRWYRPPSTTTARPHSMPSYVTVSFDAAGKPQFLRSAQIETATTGTTAARLSTTESVDSGVTDLMMRGGAHVGGQHSVVTIGGVSYCRNSDSNNDNNNDSNNNSNSSIINNEPTQKMLTPEGLLDATLLDTSEGSLEGDAEEHNRTQKPATSDQIHAPPHHQHQHQHQQRARVSGSFGQTSPSTTTTTTTTTISITPSPSLTIRTESDDVENVSPQKQRNPNPNRVKCSPPKQVRSVPRTRRNNNAQSKQYLTVGSK